MIKILKRPLSIILALLILASFSTPAFAADISRNSTGANVVRVTNSSGVSSEYPDIGLISGRWTDGCTLTLLADVSLNSMLSYLNVDSGSRVLDLNGHGLKAYSSSSYATITVSSASLTIIDSNPTAQHRFTVTNQATNGAGKATVNDNLSSNYKTFTGGYITGASSQSAIEISYGGSVTLNGGNIIGNSGSSGTVNVRGSNAHLEMGSTSTASIQYNYPTAKSAVHIDTGSFTMSGGTIHHNRTSYGGVRVAYVDCSFTMNGGTISDNYANNGGGVYVDSGTFNVSGNPVIKDNLRSSSTSNVKLNNNKYITVSGALTEGANIGVTTYSGTGVFTNSSNTAYNDASKFFGDNGKYVRANDSGQLMLYTPIQVTWNNYDGTTLKTDTNVVEGTTPVYDGATPTKPADSENIYVFTGWSPEPSAVTGNVTYTAQYSTIPVVASVTSGGTTTYYSDYNSAVSDWTGGSTLKLLADIEPTYTINVYGGARTLDLNGHGIRPASTGYPIFNVALFSTTSLTINDSNSTAEHRFTVSDPESNGAGLATVNDALTGVEGVDYQTFYGGYITGTHNQAAMKIDNGASVIMNGGNIIGNRTHYMGAVYIASNSSFTMNGGSICYNSGYSGGVYNYRGSFTMSGGTISGNKTTSYSGGGVYNYSGSFTMSGGTISGNTASSDDGGGVCNYSGSFTMSGGTISGNIASSDGGGVCNYSGSFTMSGGTISGNTASSDGGGLYSYGTFNVSGNPVISSNTSTNAVISSSGYITVTDELTSGANIGVTALRSTGVFTDSSNTAYNDASKFFGDNGNYVRANDSGQLMLYTPIQVTWNNYNGAELDTDAVAYGATPEYTGATPTRPDDYFYRYTFTGWNVEPSAVTENVTYTAQFNAVLKNTLDNPLSTPTNAGLAATTDGNLFGLPTALEYKKATFLGVQRKEDIKTDTAGTGLRFVTEISSELLSSDDFGFEVMANTYSTTQAFSDAGGFAFMDENKSDSTKVKTISCKNTSNNIVSEEYGNRNASSTPYKYVTLSVNNIPDDMGVAVRFYVVIDNTKYYADFTNKANNHFRGCCTSYNAVSSLAD